MAPTRRSNRVSSLVRSALLGGVWLALAVSLDARESHAVQRVVDGDTVVLSEMGPVRLIGVDTPETQDPPKPVQYYGSEASAFLQSMLSGQSVRVEYDHQRRDKYQRTFAYLFLSDGTFVNREIIRQGFGHAYLTYPFAYAEDFRAAEREAREAERGLWGQSPAKAAATAVGPSPVWVNTSSRVYHCPGTRYYGKTARGDYMSEGEAQRAGHRPASGRQCGPVRAGAAEAVAAAAPSLAAPSAQGARNVAATDVRVWVNTSSRVYHCPARGTTARRRRACFSDSARPRRTGSGRPGGVHVRN